MYVKHAIEGRLNICLQALAVGADLCVIVSGGTKPHIGCVTLSTPRPSLADPQSLSATTSVLNRTGHKDDAVANFVSHTLSAALNINVVVACGIHVNSITANEIQAIRSMIKNLVAEFIADSGQAEYGSYDYFCKSSLDLESNKETP